MKEFDHAIDYDLESALPRLQAWGLINIDPQVQPCAAWQRLTTALVMFGL